LKRNKQHLLVESGNTLAIKHLERESKSCNQQDLTKADESENTNQDEKRVEEDLLVLNAVALTHEDRAARLLNFEWQTTFPSPEDWL